LDLAATSHLAGNGTVLGSVTSRGAVSPDGRLTIQGDFTQTDGGVLHLDIGGRVPGTQHDVLAVTGSATFGGTLSTRRTNEFTPNDGDSFRVLTFAAHSGAFAYDGLDFGGDTLLTPGVAPTFLLFSVG